MLSGPGLSSAVHIVLCKLFTQHVHQHGECNVVVDSITQTAPIKIWWSMLGWIQVPTHIHSLFRHYLDYALPCLYDLACFFLPSLSSLMISKTCIL